LAKEQDLFPDAPIWWEGLTGKRRLFVEYYCLDKQCFLNARASYSKAFNKNKTRSDESIATNAARLCKEPKIKEKYFTITNRQV
jgi:hypothetical protein